MKQKRNVSLLLWFCVHLSAKRKKMIDNIYPVCIALKSWEEAKMGKDKKNKNNILISDKKEGTYVHK